MSETTLPISDLLRSPSRVGLMDHFLTNPDEWFRKRELTNDAGYSNTKVHEQLGSGDNPGPLVLMGVVDVSEHGVNMPRYRLADTPVTQFLTAWDGPSLTQFFTTGATIKLTEYFLQRADVDQPYSAVHLKDVLNLSHSGFTNNIERFVETGVVDAEPVGRTTEYTLQNDNEVYNALVTLNELLYETYTERVAEYDE